MFLDCWALQCWQKSSATTFIHTYKWALLYSFPFLFSINFQKWVLQWGFSEFQWGQRCGMILIWPISAGGLVTLWTLSRERREICAVRVGGCVSPKRETDELITSGMKLTKWSPTKWLVIHSKTNMQEVTLDDTAEELADFILSLPEYFLEYHSLDYLAHWLEGTQVTVDLRWSNHSIFPSTINCSNISSSFFELPGKLLPSLPPLNSPEVTALKFWCTVI